MIPAVVLAAGTSSRMGLPKALLKAPDGDSFIVRITRSFNTAHVINVIVVTGTMHDEIARSLDAADGLTGVRCVRNSDPDRGQLSSLLVGLDAIDELDAEACLVTLVDVPMVLPSTIAQVVDAWRRTRRPIVRPAIGDRHGHPVLFDRALFDELRRAPMGVGAKAVVRAHDTEIWNEQVTDEGCVTDVDTPEDYARLMAG